MEKTVLVVDDLAANRNLLGETLEPNGYEVLLATDGAMALKVAGRARPALILMDVNMPELNGYDACRRLKADRELARIPVIFITANDDPESLVKGFEAGGVDYITKPFKESEVLMRVETHFKIHSLTRALESANRELEGKNEELHAEVQRRADAERKANDANQAKSQFLSFISHEMRSGRCPRRGTLTWKVPVDSALAKRADNRPPSGKQRSCWLRTGKSTLSGSACF